MDDNLLRISLNQGKHLKKKISKIKEIKELKEGFVSLKQEKEEKKEEFVRPSHQGYVPVFKNMRQNSNLTKNINQTNLKDIEQAEQKYNDLIQIYTVMQQKIGNSSLNSVNRLSPNNPYLNKTVRFTTEHVCYVTNQGVVKLVPSMDIWNSTNIPKNYTDINLPWSNSYNTPGTTIPTNPPLISGSSLKMGESIGNEGLNVYASTLINNPSSNYIGCYNDTPVGTTTSVVPTMNSSNTNNGFQSYSSSVYTGDKNSIYGPWAAFDKNPNTFWHDGTISYNATTGIYQGQNSVNGMRGEFLQINMPGVNTPSAQNTIVNQYSIVPRSDSERIILVRGPNSWYVLGWKDNQWKVVDRQQNQNYKTKDAKVYNVASPGSYSAYILLVDKVGNDDETRDRDCVQVAEWNLFYNSDLDITDDKRAMILNPSAIGYTTLDKCQEYALDNGYKYFGLQDVTTDGTAACLVSNDVDKPKMYGDASVQRTSIPLWSSNTSSDLNCWVQLAGDGSLTVSDSSKKLYTTGGVTGCESWGTLTVQSATYGGNCKAPIGNVTDKVAKMGCNWVESCSIPISVSTFSDPVPGCVKNFDVAYSCGSTPFSKHLEGEANGQTMIMDECKQYMADNCRFFLILQDDGNMCMYRGTDPSNIKGGSVWCSNTNGQQKAPNPIWVASKGKFGRNYITTGQGLGRGEWIGSTDGSLKLIMETGGNLLLYTSETKPGCKVINGKTYGGQHVNALYELNNVGNRNTLGKLGYIDSESKLMLYPDSMFETTNNYQIFDNSDSGGNDISNLTVNNQNECQTACNNNVDCRAYTFNGNNCWLKNKNTYPKSSKAYDTGTTLGVRLPGLKGSTTCSNKIVNVDTIQFDNYIKGQEMTSTTQCNPSIVSDQDRREFDSIKSQLILLGNDIVSQTENLYNQDNNTFEKLNINKEQFKKNIENYKLTNIKIKKELNLQHNNIEGMQNQNINDINGMLNDSDLRVLQQNYTYIMWSIFAIGTLTITINALKK
jgi:hypothetical protein